MIHVHLYSEYHVRETGAWALQREAEALDDCAIRDYFAGHCLDAVQLIPAGSMLRLEPEGGTPFAASRYTHHR